MILVTQPLDADFGDTSFACPNCNEILSTSDATMREEVTHPTSAANVSAVRFSGIRCVCKKSYTVEVLIK